MMGMCLVEEGKRRLNISVHCSGILTDSGTGARSRYDGGANLSFWKGRGPCRLSALSLIPAIYDVQTKNKWVMRKQRAVDNYLGICILRFG